MVVVKRRLWAKTIIFILACVFSLRTQIELVEMIGSRTGILNVVSYDIYDRGLIIYGVFIAAFLLLAFFSGGSRKVVFMAAAISIYIFAFCTSMIALLL